MSRSGSVNDVVGFRLIARSAIEKQPSRRRFCRGAALAFVGCSLGCGNGLYPAPGEVGGSSSADQGIPLPRSGPPDAGGPEVVDGGSCSSNMRIAVDGVLPSVGEAHLVTATGSNPSIY